MTKEEMITDIAKITGYSRTHVAEITEAIFTNISVRLGQGHTVRIRGFGKFILQYKKPFRYNNPQTKRYETVPDYFYPVFVPETEVANRIFLGNRPTDKDRAKKHKRIHPRWWNVKY